jgi:hypothetical protein
VVISTSWCPSSRWNVRHHRVAPSHFRMAAAAAQTSDRARVSSRPAAAPGPTPPTGIHDRRRYACRIGEAELRAYREGVRGSNQCQSQKERAASGPELDRVVIPSWHRGRTEGSPIPRRPIRSYRHTERGARATDRRSDGLRTGGAATVRRKSNSASIRKLFQVANLTTTPAALPQERAGPDLPQPPSPKSRGHQVQWIVAHSSA